MPKVNLTPFQRHQRKWQHCQDCELHRFRRNVVLARGRVRGKIKLPVQVLYIGEGPGSSEDIFASPFVGPAGSLLDQLINQAEYEAEVKPTIAFTNVVACIPKYESGAKAKEPDKDSVKACQPRLKEFIDIAKPDLFVLVGMVASKYCAWLKADSLWTEIVHPAAILKSKDPASKSLSVRRTVVTLTEAFEVL